MVQGVNNNDNKLLFHLLRRVEEKAKSQSRMKSE
jgi:hypothetical protein